MGTRRAACGRWLAGAGLLVALLGAGGCAAASSAIVAPLAVTPAAVVFACETGVTQDVTLSNRGRVALSGTIVHDDPTYPLVYIEPRVFTLAAGAQVAIQVYAPAAPIGTAYTDHFDVRWQVAAASDSRATPTTPTARVRVPITCTFSG
jgi:hypothetical protein